MPSKQRGRLKAFKARQLAFRAARVAEWWAGVQTVEVGYWSRPLTEDEWNWLRDRPGRTYGDILAEAGVPPQE